MTDLHEDPIRIVIVDRYILERSGLRVLIESRQGMKVVGEIGEINESLDVVVRQRPDIIILNSNVSDDQGLEIIPHLLKSWDRARIILITTSNQSQFYYQAIQEGVLGVVFKTQPPEVLYKAIEKVNNGEVWIDRTMIANVLTSLSYANKLKKENPEAVRMDQISNRERQVIRLIGIGLKNQQIANELCISETTVRHHLTSIFNKLGVSDRLELLVYAHRWGLVKLPEQTANQKNENNFVER